MRHSCVHYHVAPGCVCRKTAFFSLSLSLSQRTSPSLRLRERPFVSKCVIILSAQPALLRDPLTSFICFTAPWRLCKIRMPRSCKKSLSNSQQCGWQWWHVIPDTSRGITPVSAGQGGRAIGDRWQHLARRHECTWAEISLASVGLCNCWWGETYKITSAGIRIDTSEPSSD